MTKANHVAKLRFKWWGSILCLFMRIVGSKGRDQGRSSIGAINTINETHGSSVCSSPCFFPISISLIAFPCRIALANTTRAMLNNHFLWFFSEPDFRFITYTFSVLIFYFSCNNLFFSPFFFFLALVSCLAVNVNTLPWFLYQTCTLIS